MDFEYSAFKNDGPCSNRAEWRLWRHHNRGGLCSPLHYRNHPLDACFTPTMIILNEERRIIMNKVLPTKSILPFLKRYGELHPLK